MHSLRKKKRSKTKLTFSILTKLLGAVCLGFFFKVTYMQLKHNYLNISI